MQPNGYKYIGRELDLFQKAIGWKSYYAKFIKKYCAGRVLEVGAGIGSTTPFLCDKAQAQWICLEPDSDQAASIREKIQAEGLSDVCEVVAKTVDEIDGPEQFDCILYIDVLEHLGDDKRELDQAFRLLKPGGHLVVLSPAQKWLFSEFDKAVGHFRRYTKEDFQRFQSNEIRLIESRYLDCAGALLSVINKFVLKRKHFSLSGLWFWDRCLIPVSRILDWIIFYSFGKTVLAVFKKGS